MPFDVIKLASFTFAIITARSSNTVSMAQDTYMPLDQDEEDEQDEQDEEDEEDEQGERSDKLDRKLLWAATQSTADQVVCSTYNALISNSLARDFAAYITRLFTAT
jgi:TATA-binding protein-associated factor Taf7